MPDPRFEVFTSDKDGQHYWRLRDQNGEIVAQSEGYKRPENVHKGIAAVQQDVGVAAIVEIDPIPKEQENK
jgi:uncharacterized protein YegP (UPF0339 family)